MNDVTVTGAFAHGETLRGQLNTDEYGAVPVHLFNVE